MASSNRERKNIPQVAASKSRQSSPHGPPRLSTDQDFVLTASALPVKLFGPSSLDEEIALGRFDPTATGRV
jgi:hypothetical protein